MQQTPCSTATIKGKAEGAHAGIMLLPTIAVRQLTRLPARRYRPALFVVQVGGVVQAKARTAQ